MKHHDSNAENIHGTGKAKIRSKPGILQVHLPHHRPIPFPRYVLVSDELFPGCGIHAAAHFVTSAEFGKQDHYAEPHVHDADEINLVLGNEGELTYVIRTDSERYEVTSPAGVYIPKGVPHAAEASRGSGVFVCIVLKGTLE